MRRSLKQRALLPLWTAVILLAADSARPSDKSVEIYTVNPRDTLWKLAEQFFSDPNRWTQIWSANAHIEDPDWIYPGDKLRIVLDSPGEQHAKRLGLISASPGSNAPRRMRSGTLLTKGEDADSGALVPSYVDSLIDPNVPADSYFDLVGAAQRHGGVWNLLDQSIEFHSQYRKTTQRNGLAGLDDDRGAIDLGLHYIARHHTRNWGSFRLNLIALNESNQSGFFNDGQQQTGLARFSLEQYNLPLTNRLSVNNIIGTHRQVRYNPFRDRPNLINYRLGAAEPDILGVSSQLLAGRTGVSLSAGRLGQSQGNLLPGFVRTSGHMKRAQVTHVAETRAFTGDVWRTSNQQMVANRDGYRLGYDRLLGRNTVLSMNAVGSGSNRAFLAGGSTSTDRAQHDFGAYYFEPDIVWLDQRIGDDNAGGFYRYQTRTSSSNWGGSIEIRKDGLDAGTSQKSTSGYLSLNMSHRLSRKSSLSHVYNFRTVRYSTSINEAINEHSVRSFYSTTHRAGARSSINALARVRSGQEEFVLGYGWSNDLRNDATVEFASTYRLQFTPDDRAREWLINGSLSKQFSHGTYLSAGVGYNFGRSLLDDNDGLTSYVNLEQSIGANFSLSMQLDYSRENTRYLEEDIGETFFTNNQFSDDANTGSRQFFALLRLRYQRGGGVGPEVLHSRGRGRGAGSVRGLVFVDSNNDGIRQANEPGVPGVTVFLNSVYPVLTNSRGEYSFPNVGLGSHFLFVDESALPLPWTLTQGEYTPVTVELRRSTQLNIPVSPITLAEAD